MEQVHDDNMSGGFHENYIPAIDFSNNNNNTNPAVGKKRKLNTDMDYSEDTTVITRRSFLPIRGGSEVFTTEEWRKSTSALFHPVLNDVYLNLSKYDQITATQGSFFTADISGNFSQTLMGHVLHLWRYDKSEHKLYIALSYLFTNSRDFLNIQSYLHNV